MHTFTVLCVWGFFINKNHVDPYHSRIQDKSEAVHSNIQVTDHRLSSRSSEYLPGCYQCCPQVVKSLIII